MALLLTCMHHACVANGGACVCVSRYAFEATGGRFTYASRWGYLETSLVHDGEMPGIATVHVCVLCRCGSQRSMGVV